ncbi:MAG: HD domain-containing protein [Pseudomonadota bacterium]
MTSEPHPSMLWLEESTVWNLLDQYDYPHPENPDELITGYDKNHALRTAKMCAAVAQYLGHDDDRVKCYQVACLLHDLGRAGLDQNLFGKIWTWAKTRDIPTRPAEWRAKYPETTYGMETEAFWEKYLTDMETLGITTNNWAKEQVEMRLGYERRLKRIIETVKPALEKINLNWSSWMEKVTLYYYYPEKLREDPDWVRELGEILVACEQLEAYSNRERGNDYYNRDHESFIDAFNYLDSLKMKGQLGLKVLSAVRHLTANGQFDVILEEARGEKLSEKEIFFLRSLNSGDDE